MCDTAEYCGEDMFCRPGWQPEPFCTMDSDCRTGRVCREGVCRTPCPTMTNDECMRFDSQVPECREDAGEYLCHATNEIMPECRFEADCPMDQECLDRGVPQTGADPLTTSRSGFVPPSQGKQAAAPPSRGAPS